jgi:hypothetical protein
MCVQEFCGYWMDLPLWCERFVVANQTDLEKIIASPIRQVLIDATKGKDVEGEPMPATGAIGATAPVPAAIEAFEAPSPRGRVARNEELERAGKILQGRRMVVVDMFEEARLGIVREAGRASSAVDEIANSVASRRTVKIELARRKSADDHTFMHSVAASALMAGLAWTLGPDDAQIKLAGIVWPGCCTTSAR